MKTRGYWELTKTEQINALKEANRILINYAYEGVIEIQMPNRTLKSVFEIILRNARRENSVDLFTKLISERADVQKELNRVCLIAVEGSRYSDKGFAIGIRS